MRSKHALMASLTFWPAAHGGHVRSSGLRPMKPLPAFGGTTRVRCRAAWPCSFLVGWRAARAGKASGPGVSRCPDASRDECRWLGGCRAVGQVVDYEQGVDVIDVGRGVGGADAGDGRARGAGQVGQPVGAWDYGFPGLRQQQPDVRVSLVPALPGLSERGQQGRRPNSRQGQQSNRATRHGCPISKVALRHGPRAGFRDRPGSTIPAGGAPMHKRQRWGEKDGSSYSKNERAAYTNLQE